ncbi:hypothetical protein ACM01_06165 [Streptomyces viridochromogenes]|uniref:DUF899 domain-containing protein n=1 Tax=Streptomyces viridochromogenes TaxID=1938 RepID=A0A0J7ZJT0_STRVR|nr:DUF899 family protein [Streptomyces viridochromogenes]KMS76286.1 hypothetical protein ACM01_06165 [Streptomyces viridochromogenes]KOG20399.1 hypothetical protein ADK36_16675 [Streptomyces viridochromogenes]KOG22241.1 hypothetical protein ADK35_15285 [Streptomyces viridochromogenes]
MTDVNKPPVVSREEWLAAIDTLRAREKAHTREGDAIAAARRRLPMTEADPSAPLVGGKGHVPLIDVFEGRTQLFVSYHMWHDGHTAADQCEGCTFFTGQVRELAYLHQRDVTFAVFCQGPYEESDRYRRFMGWDMPWYSVPAESHERLVAGRHFGMKACYLRDGDRVFETYWTTGRGVEPMAASYGILDMTVHGRQETWEDSPPGWPQPYAARGEQFRESGRPTAQWARIAAGHDDDLHGAQPPTGGSGCCS